MADPFLMRTRSSSSDSSLYDQALDAQRAPFADDAPGSDGSRSHPVRYSFAQAFGEYEGDYVYDFDVTDKDMISCVRINADADMVATGDRGGRIVLLQRTGPICSPRRPGGSASSSVEGDPDRREAAAPVPEPPEFTFWTQFQSHDPEFDYLKSMEIEEKINEVRWIRSSNDAYRLLAANDKTVKLWRVYEKEIKELVNISPDGEVRRRVLSPTSAGLNPNKPSSNTPWGYGHSMPPGISEHIERRDSRKLSFDSGSASPPSPASPPGPASPSESFDELRQRYRGTDASGLLVPRVVGQHVQKTAEARRVFSNAHSYHINSVSLSSDEETFLSADDLRINVWHLAVGGGSGFNVVDIKPPRMEDLTEVITCAEFHPSHCHLFLHGSSRGVVKLCDMRANALCDSWAKEFEEEKSARPMRSSFFAEIISSVADARFAPDARFILTRDYMTMRLWDVRLEREPVLTVPVHEHLRPRLAEMYQNDCVFDKFECAFSHDGKSLLTGSYASLFQAYSAFDGHGAAVEASVDFAAGIAPHAFLCTDGAPVHTPARATAAQLANPMGKILHLDAAQDASFAVAAAGPSLYMYYVPDMTA